MTTVVGILLGAGSSRRLGRPKQTLPFGDTTLLGHVLRDAEASSLDRVVLVLGGAAEEALAGAAPGRAEVVVNDAYGSGCASSLLAGLDAAGAADAVLLILGDMPGVGAEVIDAVRAGWERARPWAAVADYRGAPGHPLAFSAAAFPALRALHGDKAVWKLLEAHAGRFLRVPVDRDLPPDVDTWADYETARSELLP
ncbi:MAG TPA: nucleotidyltransferase family protein [Miltoncostaeaceae bacterium]|nr:nucleotidyltransferase family protein [Miltoncostaeaceae bacterium]